MIEAPTLREEPAALVGHEAVLTGAALADIASLEVTFPPEAREEAFTGLSSSPSRCSCAYALASPSGEPGHDARLQHPDQPSGRVGRRDLVGLLIGKLS